MSKAGKLRAPDYLGHIIGQNRAGFADNWHLGQTVTDPNGANPNGATLSVGHLVTGGWRGCFPLLQRGSEGGVRRQMPGERMKSHLPSFT